MRSRSPRTITLALVGATLAAAVPVAGIVSSIEMLLRPAYFRALVAPTPVASLLKHYLMVTAVMLSSTCTSPGGTRSRSAAPTWQPYAPP